MVMVIMDRVMAGADGKEDISNIIPLYRILILPGTKIHIPIGQ